MRKEFVNMAATKSRATKDEDEEFLCRKRSRKFYSDRENEQQEVVVENFASPAASRTSGFSKDDDSNGVVRKSPRAVPDLENLDGCEREISTSMAGDCFSREATPTSELCGDSEELLRHSPPATKKLPSKTRRKFAEMMPSAAELEEFFTAAEKYEQKRFAEKYNYDIAKDVPLEGRYHWLPL